MNILISRSPIFYNTGRIHIACVQFPAHAPSGKKLTWLFLKNDVSYGCSFLQEPSSFHCLDTKGPIKHDHRKILPALDSCVHLYTCTFTVCTFTDMNKLSEQKVT